MFRFALLLALIGGALAQYNTGESCLDSLGRVGRVRRGRDVFSVAVLSGNPFLRQELVCATDCSRVAQEGTLCVGGHDLGSVDNSTLPSTWPTPFGNCMEGQCVNFDCRSQTSLGQPCSHSGTNQGFCGQFDPRALGFRDPEPGLLDVTRFHAQTCTRDCAPGTASGFPPQDVGCENSDLRGSLCTLVSDAQQYFLENTFVQHRCQTLDLLSASGGAFPPSPTNCPPIESSCFLEFQFHEEGCDAVYRPSGTLCLAANNQTGLCVDLGTGFNACQSRTAGGFDIFGNPAHVIGTDGMSENTLQNGLGVSTCGTLTGMTQRLPLRGTPLPCVTINQNNENALGVCTTLYGDTDYYCQVSDQCASGAPGSCSVAGIDGFCLEYPLQVPGAIGTAGQIQNNATCAQSCASDLECQTVILPGEPAPPSACQISRSFCHVFDAQDLATDAMDGMMVTRLSECRFDASMDTVCNQRNSVCGLWGCTESCAQPSDAQGCCLLRAADSTTPCNLPGGGIGMCTGTGYCAPSQSGQCVLNADCPDNVACADGECQNGQCVYLPRTNNTCQQRTAASLNRQCSAWTCDPSNPDADGDGCVVEANPARANKPCILDSDFVQYARLGDGLGVCIDGVCQPAPANSPPPAATPLPPPGAAPPMMPRRPEVDFSDSEFPLGIDNKWNFIDGLQHQRVVRGSPSDFSSSTVDLAFIDSLDSFDSRMIQEPWAFATNGQLRDSNVPAQRFNISPLTDDDEANDAAFYRTLTSIKNGMHNCGVPFLRDLNGIDLPVCGGFDQQTSTPTLEGVFYSEVEDDEKFGCSPVCYCKVFEFEDLLFSSPVACTRKFWPRGKTAQEESAYYIGLSFLWVACLAVFFYVFGLLMQFYIFVDTQPFPAIGKKTMSWQAQW